MSTLLDSRPEYILVGYFKRFYNLHDTPVYFYTELWVDMTEPIVMNRDSGGYNYTSHGFFVFVNNSRHRTELRRAQRVPPVCISGKQ